MKTSTKKIAKRQSSPMSSANRVSLLHDSRSLISRDYGTIAILMRARLRQSDFYYSIAVNRAQSKNKKQKNKMECDADLALRSDNDLITTQSADTENDATAKF